MKNSLSLKRSLMALSVIAASQVMAGNVTNTTATPTSLISITTGDYNTGLGDNALQKTSTGSHNTASGFGALRLNTLASATPPAASQR